MSMPEEDCDLGLCEIAECHQSPWSSVGLIMRTHA